MRDFKAILGFKNYLIFRDGRVYSLIRGKFLKPRVNRTGGYYRVELRKSGKRYNKRIARLIAQAFIPNPENKPEINHRDGNKLNNDFTNLEWCTRSENMLHAYKNGLKKKSPNSGPPEMPVNVYDFATGKFLSIQPSQNTAARMYGVFQSSICCVLAGRQKYTKGLTFTKA